MTSVAFKGHIVFCRDVEASARFYEDLLGFEREDDGESDVTLRVPVAEAAGASVSILLHHSDKPEAIDLGMFDVDDVDAVIAKVRAAGCAIGTEPADAPWGVREASFADPDGNGLYVNGPLRS